MIMGLIDKIFKKEDEKSSREVGSNFDKDDANAIFDALDKHDSKEIKELSKMEKAMKPAKEAANLIKEAKKSDDDAAIELYKQALVLLPDASEAYKGLADIYHRNNRLDDEAKILKLGIKNIENSKMKNSFIERLKEM